VLITFYFKFIVNSISNIIVNNTISIIFVGLILLLIVRNAAEYIIVVTVTYKDKINLVINIVIRFSIQITLLILPFIIIFSWIIG
jgi:calcium/proton exchanger cax